MKMTPMPSSPSLISAMLMIATFTFLLPAVSARASARETRELKFKDYVVELQENEKVVIQGLRGSIKLQPAQDSKTLTLKVRKTLLGKANSEAQTLFDGASFQVKRELGFIVVSANGPTTGEEWAKWTNADKMGSHFEFHFEVEVPPVATEVILREGIIAASGTKQPMALHLVNGSMKLNDTEGPLKVQIQKGDLKVEGHSGRLEVDSYYAKVFMQKVRGELQMTNFGGESSLADIKGNIEMRTQAGATTLAKSTGAVNFFSGRGSLNLQDFEGSIRGQVDQGSVVADLNGDADVSIESDQGTVSLRMPANSGAYVKIQSEEGAVNAPDPLKSASTSSGSKIITGRLSGQGPKGHVNVKSKSGSIRVR